MPLRTLTEYSHVSWESSGIYARTSSMVHPIIGACQREYQLRNHISLGSLSTHELITAAWYV